MSAGVQAWALVVSCAGAFISIGSLSLAMWKARTDLNASRQANELSRRTHELALVERLVGEPAMVTCRLAVGQSSTAREGDYADDPCIVLTVVNAGTMPANHVEFELTGTASTWDAAVLLPGETRTSEMPIPAFLDDVSLERPGTAEETDARVQYLPWSLVFTDGRGGRWRRHSDGRLDLVEWINGEGLLGSYQTILTGSTSDSSAVTRQPKG